MASNITLSASVRQNLLSLQSTAQLMSMTQNRLATGKKVNSALDNPGNFFTSQSLSNRASDLNTLLDSIGQAQQTLKAADTGISSLTKLVESAKSLAKQAQQSSAPAATYSLSVSGTPAFGADTVATATGTTATLADGITGGTEGAVASFEFDASDLSSLTDGDLVTVEYGGTTHTFEFDDDSTVSTSGAVGFTDAASLTTAFETAFGAANVDNASDVITISGTGFAAGDVFTTGGAAAATALIDSTANTTTAGSTITINDGTNTATFTLVGAGEENAAAGTFSDLTSLQAAAADAGVDVAGVTFDEDDDGNLVITKATGSFTVGGTLSTDLGIPTTSNTPTNSGLAALAGQSLSITVGNGTANTFTFSATSTISDLQTWASGLTLGTGITASVSNAGALSVTSTSASNITVNGSNAAVNTAMGLSDADGVYQPTAAFADPSATRTTYENQYNDLLKQIDSLAKDATYNGINLLAGDDLKVVFNEDGSSSLSIEGVSFDATSLGLTELTDDEFQSNTSIDTVLASIDAALGNLRTQAAKFGSNLSTVQTRQDFTKNMINNLQVGSDALVLADTNEEGANLLALQTRQQLSTTALSLSAQADQAVLRLF